MTGAVRAGFTVTVSSDEQAAEEKLALSVTLYEYVVVVVGEGE